MSGGDLLVEAKVLFDGCDADIELEAFVELGREAFLDDGEIARVIIENLRVVGERGFHGGDVVLGGGNIIFDSGDVFGKSRKLFVG